jgi:RNA polymerase sigma factor (sigma-70 family)
MTNLDLPDPGEDAPRTSILRFPTRAAMPLLSANRARVLSAARGTILRNRMDSQSSVELLERVRNGDSDALEILLRRYLPALRRWASGRLPQWARDLAETEDLVQETVFKSLKRLPGFEYRQEGALQSYLRRAVLNRIRDECRRARRAPAFNDLDENARYEGLSPLDAAIGVEGVERYEAALERLREQDREAIVARIEMGYSYGEIAVMLGKSNAEAARQAVSRALVRLAEEMRGGR